MSAKVKQTKQLPKPEDVKEFTISRKRWLRGTYDNPKKKSCLYKPHDRTMCCLGFYGRELGAKVCEINKVLTPQDAYNLEKFTNWPEWLLKVDQYSCTPGRKKASEDSVRLMKTNDSSSLPDAERERIVKEIFAQHGVTVKFVD